MYAFNGRRATYRGPAVPHSAVHRDRGIRLDTLVVNGAGLEGGSIDTTSILARDPSYIWPATGSTVKNLRGGTDWMLSDTNMKFEPFRTVVRPGEREHSRSGGDASGIMARFGVSGVGGGSYNITQSIPTSVLTDRDITVQMDVRYIYLDQAERERFSQASTTLLMMECQENSSNATHTSPGQHDIILDFQHPTVELLWAARQSDKTKHNSWFDFAGVVEPSTGLPRDPFTNVKLTLNNAQRFHDEHDPKYFRTIQPWMHHSNCPLDKFVSCWSAALHPEDQSQASGSINLSRIDSKKLHFSLDPALFMNTIEAGGRDLSGNSVEVIIYSRSWNLLRITMGLAGKGYQTG